MEDFTAFAVIELQPRRYQPSRIEVVDGVVKAIIPLKEAMPYQAVAYEYLAGEIGRYYAGLTIIEAAKAREAEKAAKRGPGRPKKGK